jgi:hypothetical protein
MERWLSVEEDSVAIFKVPFDDVSIAEFVGYLLSVILIHYMKSMGHSVFFFV